MLYPDMLLLYPDMLSFHDKSPEHDHDSFVRSAIEIRRHVFCVISVRDGGPVIIMYSAH